MMLLPMKNRTNTIDRNNRRKRADYIKALIIGAVLLVGLIMLQFYLSYVKTGRLQNEFYEYSKLLGLRVQHIYVDGNNHLTYDFIRKLIKINKNDPLLARSPDEIKEELEEVDWVREAIVDRQFPNSIYIKIIERKPIAVGQNNRNIFLIDDEGVVIREKDLKSFSQLPIVVCEDPVLFSKGIYKIISKTPKLYNYIDSVIRVGERRWNIRFKNNLEVKLPENSKQLEKSWNLLINLEKKNELFNPEIKNMDLRIEGKLFIEKY